MDTAIEVNDLVLEYAGRRVVDGLSFSVDKGQIFGFLGPNGAGKSTTIKAMLGLVFARSGKILIQGAPPSDPRSRARLGFMPEEATYYRFLTPEEILHFYGELFGLPSQLLRERTGRLLELVGLSKFSRKMLGTFSKGMVQKVSLAQTLINDPDVLVLDEPTTGLDPLAKRQLREILSDLKRQGKTIFFSSHELSEVELLCDSVMIIQSGKCLRSGSLQDVLKEQGSHSLESFFLRTIGGAA